jgi:carbon catabolite-derepressing protein kinase
MASTLDDEDLSMAMPANSSRRGPSRTSEAESSSQASPRPPHSDRQRSEQMRHRTGRLGQYTIVRTLGEGSFGKVKLAVNQHTGEQVALKIINRKKLVSRDMAGRIEREIQYLQLLRHPHIIKL